MDIVEFYVSCNPPLLPKGVALIFASVEERKDDLGILEILYEPEIPWFKLIAPRASQREVSDWMHSQLEELIESEADAVIRDEDKDDHSTSAIQLDIEVLVEEPHIIAFPSLQTIPKDILNQYDTFRYPDTIKTLSYKTVWRVPESSGVTIMQILSNYESLGSVSPLGPSIDSLQALTKCVITHNFQGSLLYIGSSESEQALSVAKRKLDTLANFMDSPLPPTAHMVLTENSSLVTLCYRYMTHTGLSRLTYVDSAGTYQSEDQEYASIASAVSLRIESVSRYRQPVPDSVKYPIPEPGNLATWQPEFHPFSGYSYGNKRSGTIAVSENKRPRQKVQHQESDSIDKITSPKGNRNLKHISTTDLPQVRKCLEAPRYHARNHKKITNWLYSIESSGDGDHLKPPSFLIEDNGEQGQGISTESPCDSCPETSRSIDEPREPRLVNTKDVPLLEAKIKYQMPESDYQASSSQLPLGLDLPKNSLKLLNFPNPSDPQSNTTKDLMDINDGPITTPALMDSIPLHDRGNRLQTASEDQGVHSEVTFGKRNHQEKRLFDTMRQKAASGLSWANVASKKKEEKRDDKPTFGLNIPVTFVPDNRSATPTPATPTSEVIASFSHVPAKQKEEHAKDKSNSTEKPKPDPIPQTFQIVPGMDMPSTDQVDYSEILSQAENKLSKLVEVLQIVPGKVSIQAQFGRLCRKDTFPALVYDGQAPSWAVNKTVEALNTENPHMGFYPILTTSGAEANTIPQMFGGRSPWLLTEKRVYYEFHCVAEKTLEAVVEVDADTFQHQYFPPATEVSKAFVHCTRRAWDVKFSVSRMYMEGMADDMEEFAASLVRSMSIETNEMGELVISTETKSTSNLGVDKVRICHEARYRNGGKGPSCLKVTMIRRVEKLPGIPKGTYRGQSVPVTPPENGRPGQWFETSISSTRAEEIFQENMGLEFGDKTHWTPETLQHQGVFRAIAEPALQMVSPMDHVGDSNSNGQGPRTDRQSYSAAQDSKDRQKGKYFW
ncbi:hypothetical protein FOXG_00650 [Fusarium oxysporum f. sp. lycopersici 4287]|uniref:Uncharacterized protein n=1 Tax=Fusarium oxysporum f. sp. lycopersici (strain 4287 / CBS 123668 / FGSC 9935 / NRRL 34936) TaxID=426428 RepID=A0A0J9U723_FUSO4|nr:hypothetical protein FOXG_00650 [Fusarium oxysporum f. sp. lycopersici 4287]KAJ9428652.1 hypothetical protein QL093DRAFT_2143395 [Fusarium oxysporum]KNA94769.1 hypothetical protein FOXG_00650 [Fusarium oxysporum f. sp. lycopersici 4287]